MLINRRSILSLLGLAATTTVVGGITKAEGLIEPLPKIVPNGVYDWSEHKHTIVVTDDYIIAELCEESSNKTFPIGTRMMFEGTIAPDGWTIIS